MKNIIFLLQEHNSIDQITPLIDVLSYRYNITLIKTFHKYNYNEDNNLKYLIEAHPSIVVKDLFCDKNRLYMILHNLYNFLYAKNSLQHYKLSKFIYYVFTGLTRRSMVQLARLSDWDASNIYKNFDPNDTIVVTEITNGDHNYAMLLKKAKELGYFNIAFTHGFDVLVNELLTYKDFVLTGEDLVNDATKYSDKMVVFNSLAIKRCYGKHHKKLLQLPSLRFTSYWMNRLSGERKKFNINNNYKLKIVFMLSAVGYNIWEDEQFRTIRAILMHQDIYLIIKVHPRDTRIKNKFLKFNQDNFSVIDNSIPSSVLIDWADIVMTIGSGIIIEAIIKNKIAFYMRYLHCNEIELEKSKNIIHQVETRDEFISLLNKYKLNINNSYIDQKERKEFLKDYILNDDFEENRNLYLELFESLSRE